jgi:DNA-binding PadR family transcriptional regulator
MSSSTHLAILGGLSVESMSGYALREAIRDVIGHFWSESFGQIYPALDELVAGGFVERQEGSRSTASTFAITALGRERLRELLREPLVSRPARNGSLLRLYFGVNLGPDPCVEILDDLRRAATKQLQLYRAIRTEIEGDEEHRADGPYWLTTVSYGEHMAEATIAWARQSMDALTIADQGKAE